MLCRISARVQKRGRTYRAYYTLRSDSSSRFLGTAGGRFSHFRKAVSRFTKRDDGAAYELTCRADDPLCNGRIAIDLGSLSKAVPETSVFASNPEATDFVLSANWYSDNEARRWAVRTVVDPVIEAGYGLTLFCYEGWPMWPEPYARCWRASANYLTTAEQYRHGRVVLGLNNQRSGMDGRALSYMTSMRTFEALACGKPFLASHSDAYARLGLVKGEHMAWADSPAETTRWAARLLGPEGEVLARAGREFVLAHHTYAHRLKRIVEVVLG